MTLILDSASVDDARRAAAMGFITAITTNPVLLAKTMAEDQRLKSREDVVAALCDVFPGTVMVQLMADTAEEREAEGRRLVNLRPGRIGLKIPAVPDNFPLARRFAADGYTVGMTTIFSAGQAYLACEAGATIIFPYVNRSTRWLGDGLALVRQMRAVVDALKSPAQIIAASLKTPDEAVETLLAGAHGLTVPMEIIWGLGHHPLSDRAIAEFASAG
jgi:transaldolase